ncbi:hypothetical protein [Vibrio sp. FJH11]
MNTNRKFSTIRTATLAVSSLALTFSMSAFARLDGAIFTTTPLGDIVNENVRYESKEEVFLDGGPGPNAPRTAAALPAGLYYFQVTDPSGKCLLSSVPGSADTNGGTCFEDVKLKGKNAKNADAFYAEPLACRLFYFDGEDGVTFINDFVTITQEVRVRGKMVPESVEIECSHQLGSEYLDINPAEMPDGETIQLFPFANTPNSGGVYKAWVSTAESVEAACEGTDLGSTETGENCDGFFGFIPRNSKTDNFKAQSVIPEPPNFDIALRSFHDKNLNCQYDPLVDEIIPNWEFGLRDLTMDPNMRNTKLSNDSPDEPVTFSVFGVEDRPWSVDQFMWWAQSVGFSAMNTPFTHFTTFADLRDFAPTFSDGDLHIGFANALACHDNITGNVRRSAGEDTDEASGEEESDTGFIPSAWAEPTFDDDPVLTIRFGSIGIASLEVCKSFDADGNGAHDEGETLIPDWPVTLVIPDSVPVPKPFAPDGIVGNYDDDEFERLEKLLLDAGYLEAGETLTPVEADGSVRKTTGSDGCVEFHVLVPNVRGDDPAPYSISEDVASLTPTWMNTSAYNITFDVESVLSEENGAPVVKGVVRNRSDGNDGNQVYFNNVCTTEADFNTKGYWHNKVGLPRLTEADVDHVNSLAPYATPSSYFVGGDEPFDGYFTGGVIPVKSAFKNESDVWEAGTWQAEISHFLTESIDDPREQLAQQLLAFIFNTRHQLNNPDGTIMFNGEWTPVADIIAMAINAWSTSTNVNTVKTLLDDMNNNDHVQVFVASPEDCPAPYPVD